MSGILILHANRFLKSKINMKLLRKDAALTECYRIKE